MTFLKYISTCMFQWRRWVCCWGSTVSWSPAWDHTTADQGWV